MLEIHEGGLVPVARGALEAILATQGCHTLLAPDEERELATGARAGDRRCRDKLMAHNQRLVIGLARKYAGRGMDLEDLIQEGNLGLMHAVEKFEPERGFRFSTYASWWVQNYVERAAINTGALIRMPMAKAKQARAVVKVQRQLQAQGKATSPEDISRRTGLPLELVRALSAPPASICSLDDIDEADEGETPEEAAARGEMQDLVQRCLADLSDQQRAVVEGRFGLRKDQDPLSLSILADEIGVTPHRVKKILSDALQALRQKLAAMGVLEWG